MTFADRLDELRVRISTEKNALERYRLLQQQDAFLANNADAILELVRAAEPALESLEYAIRNMDERSYWEMMRGQDKPQKLTAHEAFKKALAKLNGEQT